jgi:4-hydroxy-2-oxoheptanedioate aldolase
MEADMRTNKLKAKIRAGEKAWGVGFKHKWLPMVELAAQIGFDYIFIEGEHGVLSLQDIEEMCMLADALGLSTVARVPSLAPETILQYLDVGVMGIRAPHVSSRAEAEALVKACKFAPEGIRSFSAGRAAEYSKPNDLLAYMARANEEVMTIALVEDEEGLRTLPEILEVDGLDVVAFGPYDLAQSMGESSPAHPRVVEAIQRAAEQIRASGKIRERDLMDRTYALHLFATGAQQYLKEVRGS